MNISVLTAIGVDADRWARPLATACALHDILTESREQMFLAQCCHESAGFTRLVENLNYSADGLIRTWPSRFTAAEAVRMERRPEVIANYVYAGRMGNGDEASGDGWRYRGRGVIQITGRSNYMRFGRAIGADLIASPELLEADDLACRSAAWFWQTNGCNELSDAHNFTGTTRRINGGMNGQADRLRWLVKIRQAWSDT